MPGILRGIQYAAVARTAACSDKQVGYDHENPNLCGEPTDRPYTRRPERVGGNIKQPGDDEHPSPDCRQRAGGMSCMHQEQGGDELWKYLKQVTVRPNKAPAHTCNLARFVTGPCDPSAP